MIRFFFLLSILQPLNLFAYSAKDLKLSSFEYTRYIKPQFKSIISDFYGLVSEINPQIQNIKSAVSEIKKIQTNLDETPPHCSLKNQTFCREKLSELKKSFIKLYDFKMHPAQLDSSIQSFDHYLDASLQFKKFDANLFYLYIQISKDLQSLNSFSKVKIPKENIKIQLGLLKNSFILYHLKTLPSQVSTVFILFWSSYIKLVDEQMFLKNGELTFRNKINHLNISLNQFLMFMTKRSNFKKKSTDSYYKLIHRRWNNILKISLR